MFLAQQLRGRCFITRNETIEHRSAELDLAMSLVNLLQGRSNLASLYNQGENLFVVGSIREEQRVQIGAYDAQIELVKVKLTGDERQVDTRFHELYQQAGGEKKTPAKKVIGFLRP